METITRLTQNQINILNWLVPIGNSTERYYAEAGYSDICLNTDLIPAMELLGMNKEQTRRSFIGMVNKDIFTTETTGDRKDRFTIIYLTPSFYHLVSEEWQNAAWCSQSGIDTTNPVPENKSQPTGERGPLTPMTEQIYDCDKADQMYKAYCFACKLTTEKNAKTAMSKFMKSNRVSARYYGMLLTKALKN